ncbi:MAG: M23 family metallopeptidase [Candidatus Nanopelagicales bacterium]
MTTTSTTIAAATAAGVLAVGVAGAATAAQTAPAPVTASTTVFAKASKAQSKAARAAKVKALKRKLITLPDGRKLPVRDYRVGAGFGHSSGPHAGRSHGGLDLAASTGTPIYSATDGKVVIAKSYYGYGNLVAIRTAGGSTIYYGHQSKILVKKGKKVHAGDKIGKVGSTGYSTGPHLHFEVRTKHDNSIDPLKYLDLSRSALQKRADKLDKLR